jgi:hypothetical protein
MSIPTKKFYCFFQIIFCIIVAVTQVGCGGGSSGSSETHNETSVPTIISYPSNDSEQPSFSNSSEQQSASPNRPRIIKREINSDQLPKVCKFSECDKNPLPTTIILKRKIETLRVINLPPGDTIDISFANNSKTDEANGLFIYPINIPKFPGIPLFAIQSIKDISQVSSNPVKIYMHYRSGGLSINAGVADVSIAIDNLQPANYNLGCKEPTKDSLLIVDFINALKNNTPTSIGADELVNSINNNMVDNELNCCGVLGIPYKKEEEQCYSEFSQELEDNYLWLSTICHPDLNDASKEAENVFYRLEVAYNWLKSNYCNVSSGENNQESEDE